MRTIALSILGLMASGGAALACPAMNMSSGATMMTGTDLSVPQTFNVTAGGDYTLDQCGLGMLGFGQFRSVPDVSFVPPAMEGNPLTLSVTSDCDPTLLVNSADGGWHFNDDTNGLNPAITLSNPAETDGQIDVWVGTYAGGGCAAVLNVQAEGGGMAQPVPVPTPAPAPQPVPVPVPAPAAPQPVPVPVPVPVAPAIPATCPDPSIIGPSLTLTGAQLMTPQGYVANVTGGQDLYECQLGDDVWGYASQGPQFTLNMSQMNGVIFSAETTSDCDPVMLIHDAMGNWHFNDDGPNDLQPRLELDGSVLNGQVDIWVGSYGGSECAGTIVFQTVSGSMDMGGGGMDGAMGGSVCPNPDMMGQVVTTTGQALYSPTDYSTTAGRPAQPMNCGLGVDAWGSTSEAPSYSFMLSGMEAYGRLEIEGTGTCDTTLLVRTPDGQWYFNDDGPESLQPEINIPSGAQLNGRVDVWLGTFGDATCVSSFEMETWNS